MPTPCDGGGGVAAVEWLNGQQQHQHQPHSLSPSPSPPAAPLAPAAAAAPPLAGGSAAALGPTSRHAAAAKAAATATATATAAAPLGAAASGATLNKDLHTVEWNGQVSASSYHLFVNDTPEPLELSWGDGGGATEVAHGTIPPRGNLFVGTYEFHTWRVRSASRGLVCTHSGPSAIVKITPDGATAHLNTTTGAPPPPPASLGAGGGGGGATGRAGGGGGRAAGAAAAVAAAAAAAEPGYRQRGEVLGMPIWAFDCVPDAAVSRLRHVVGRMLADSPDPGLVPRLRAGGASFAVFGRRQVASDVPAHRLMAYNTGRHIDTSARGLGATPSIPVTSCGEENLTMERDRWYPCQSILVHEVGHAVHSLGLGPGRVAGVMAAYSAALQAGRYPPGCYMALNEQEYWAVGTEAWFESSIRTDVSAGPGPDGGGLRRLTRADLRAHDPPLAALLQAAFGDGDWRYWQDCPRPLEMPTHESLRPSPPSSEGEEEAGGRRRQQQQGRSSNGGSSVKGGGSSNTSWRTRRPARLKAVGRGTFDFDPEEEQEEEEEEEGEESEGGGEGEDVESGSCRAAPPGHRMAIRRLDPVTAAALRRQEEAAAAAAALGEDGAGGCGSSEMLACGPPWLWCGGWAPVPPPPLPAAGTAGAGATAAAGAGGRREGRPRNASCCCRYSSGGGAARLVGPRVGAAAAGEAPGGGGGGRT
ncbi:hypothetical protein HXX76_010897 [Chlamydomonas incerta]|uniref:von Hippel-Lindau disease tumour suppressor beta domain-containing protein n=1 Tax=Chlamydomonas incerta TaxID=51695 RepID=A0A835SHB0_CHLIN|nr:hypothetical protein HXX76_010897 [Chlamydomonas incerta]|eukprot:KAG2427178.1 hypothetical protein HXX76_010897 [Chlamydomonas incerta]